MAYDDIKKKCVEENLFGAAKEYRALRMAGYIITRVKAMDDTLVDLFCTSDLATQKLLSSAMSRIGGGIIFFLSITVSKLASVIKFK